MTHHPLPHATEVPRTEPYLRTVGEAVRAFRDQEPGCVSYGVRPAHSAEQGERFTSAGELVTVWRRSVS